MIDLYFRAFSRARWDAFALNRNIADASGDVQPGFAVDHLGFFQLTDAVMNGMTVATPPTFDTWWSVNLRIYGTKATADEDSVYPGENGATSWKFIRSKLVKFVRDQSTIVSLPFRGDTVRAYQFGTTVNRIQLLDPRDITFPRQQWFGGNFL